ncbi:MAG: SulP family inorganic anion transporter [Bacteroidetes bacterium]|nr:SulP family inorganic anion transporter [Bacteroidota bacterium]
MLNKIFPILTWLPNYTTNLFKKDLVAGITLSAYAIPVSLAYASLAGLPPQYGIYGYLIGGLFYAIFGTSKQMAVGPTSAISILVGTAIASLAEGDAHRWIDIASVTAFLFALMSIAAYFLKLSSMINFISETVLVGFKAGAALTIGLSQLPKLFGVSSGGHTFLERAKELFFQIPNTNWVVFGFGISALIILIAGDKLLPGKPVAILVVFISIILISFTSLGTLGFNTVGIIPTGLPEFYFPTFRLKDLENDAALAFACFLLAYIETVSAAKTLAKETGEEIDVRQELLALGAANMATSMGHGYPVSGGLSQSAVNSKAGAKTPMALVVASFTIAICLLFFTGLLKNLPTVVLAGVVIVAIKGLVKIDEFKRMWRVNRQDFLIAICAFLSVLMFGILDGVIIGAVVSLILIIKIVSTPNVAFLGKIPGTNAFSNIERHPDNEIIPNTLIFRVESPLLYFNVNTVYKTIATKLANERSDLKYVVFDLSASAYIDSSGARLIERLHGELSSRGVVLKLANAHSKVRDVLRKENVESLFGHVGRRDSLLDVVNGIVQREINYN